MTSDEIMNYMRSQLATICNEKNARNRQIKITEILCELQSKLEYLEDNSFINGQNNILMKVWSD